MDLLKTCRNVRNHWDFSLRRVLRFPGPAVHHASDSDGVARQEVGDFLRKFGWEKVLGARNPDLQVADIGAKNFFLAPLLDAFFRARGFSPEIHGIEVDAFRRYGDFRLRAQYGEFYASQIEKGRFYPINFLDFERPLDLALLLNPFVTESPLLAWGLPLRFLDPQALLDHARHLLTPNRGLLLVSHPSEDELQINVRLARRAGFRLIERQQWTPSQTSLQRQGRMGALFGI